MTPGLEDGMFVSDFSPTFNDGCSYICFKLKRNPDSRLRDAESVQMDIWSYKDSILQSIQLAAGKPPYFWNDDKYFESVCGIEDERVIQLEQNEDEFFKSYR